MIRRILGAAVVVLAGCSGSPRPLPSVEAVETLTRVDAFHGRPLVITMPAGDQSPTIAEATLDDGARIPARLYDVNIRFSTREGSGDEQWLPAAGEWATKPVPPRPAATTPGPRVLEVQLPGTSSARVLAVGGRRYLLNWLPSLDSLPPADPHPTEPLLNPWMPIADDALRSDAGLLRRLASERQSPLTRWRFHLLIDGLNQGAQDQRAAAFTDPVIEEIAVQNEDRWRVALASLWSINPELAWRLKQRLAAVVDFGRGTFAPAWSVDHSGLDRLLSDLLNSDTSAARRVELTESWLADQPAGVAWVVDDGAVLDDRRRMIIATLGFANLIDHDTRIWSDSRGGGEVDFRALASHSTVHLMTPAPVSDAGLASVLSAHVGKWSRSLPVLSAPVRVVPPGLIIGPLLSDFTMQTWCGAEAPQLPRPEWTTAALLHRPPADPTAPASSIESRRWELLVECRLGAGATESTIAGETVDLYFGSSDHPSSILRVAFSGRITNLAPLDPSTPLELVPPSGQTEVVRGADRWSFRVALPPGSIEPDGIVRFGLIRSDALGRRTAWPRPLLPWQQAPARVCLSVAYWVGDAESPHP